MRVCIKWQISSTSLRRGLPHAHAGQRGTIIMNPSVEQPPILFLCSWLRRPIRAVVPGRAVPAGPAEGMSPRKSHSEGRAVTGAAVLMRENSFIRELRRSWQLIFWLRSTTCYHFLGLCGTCFCRTPFQVVFWYWDEWISLSHEQRSLQGQIHWEKYTYACICIFIYVCDVLLITNQRLCFNTGMLVGELIFFSFQALVLHCWSLALQTNVL